MITKRAIIFIIPALLNLFHISVATESKCASILVTVEGVIIGSQDDTFKIAVRVIPDSNSSLQPEIPITNGHFKGSILFDTTESGSSNRHKCARVPEKVHVVLLTDRSEIDSVWLTVAKSFTKDKTGDYTIRSPIELHSK